MVYCFFSVVYCLFRIRMLEDEERRNSNLLFEASFQSQGLTIRTSTHNLRKTFPISYYPIIIIFKKCLEETYLVKCSTKLSCKNSQPLQKSDLERKIPTGSHRALGFLKSFSSSIVLFRFLSSARWIFPRFIFGFISRKVFAVLSSSYLCYCYYFVL